MTYLRNESNYIYFQELEKLSSGNKNILCYLKKYSNIA